MEGEKSKVQQELDNYRKDGIAYLSDEDTNIDFSKVDAPIKTTTPNE
jgi:hypothetical protein